MEHKGFTLVAEETGAAVSVGDTLTCFRGETYTLTGGASPHKPSSTGFVYVRDDEGGQCEYYAGVFNLKWIEA